MKYILAASIILLAAMPAYADNFSYDYGPRIVPIPQDFMFEGKPINPNCLSDFISPAQVAKKEVSLKDCSHPAQEGKCFFNENHDEDEYFNERYRDFGSMGYCYPGDRSGYIAYRYIGALRGHQMVLVEANWGGSMTASDLLSLEIHGDSLRLVENDYKNSGADVKIENGKIYSIGSIQGGPLESRMLADTDVAEYEDGNLKTVRLNKYFGEFDKLLVEDSRFPVRRKENCFLKVHQSYLDKGKTTLSAEEWKQLLQEAADGCK
jgi:hypothetical protein